MTLEIAAPWPTREEVRSPAAAGLRSVVPFGGSREGGARWLGFPPRRLRERRGREEEETVLPYCIMSGM